MRVENPMALLTEKFANMLDYAQTTYPKDCASLDMQYLRSLSASVLTATIRAQFMPHRLRIEQNDDLDSLADSFPDQYQAMLKRAAADDKMRRYLLLFIDLCD